MHRVCLTHARCIYRCGQSLKRVAKCVLRSLQTLARCCSFRLVQWSGIVASLSLPFQFTLLASCCCGKALSVLCWPLALHFSFCFWFTLSSSLPYFIGASMCWLHSADLGMKQ